MQSDRQLKHWYSKFNRLYFNGSLPDHTVLYWEPPSAAWGSACPVFEVDYGQFYIKIDPSIRSITDYWKMILLHEMVHIKLWTKHPKHNHGKLFQAEMLRIANMGGFKRLW